MDPSQLRETTMDPNTRRLVQLTYDLEGRSRRSDIRINGYVTRQKRAEDRKNWLQTNGDQVDLTV